MGNKATIRLTDDQLTELHNKVNKSGGILKFSKHLQMPYSSIANVLNGFCGMTPARLAQLNQAIEELSAKQS
jgi:hypothetical protein